jgi:two-component system sensor histidine kinase KdpD
LLVETERLRHSLFSAISHDLRTPLATILGASGVLAEDPDLSEASRAELARSIFGESKRLSRLVSNLLEMTRLEAGAMVVRKEWQPIEEVVGSVLNRMTNDLKQHPAQTRLEPGLPLVPIDQLLVEQVLVNLVENAIKHTPTDTPIEIGASADGQAMTVEVADRGPGVPIADLEKIFDKFYQLKAPGRRGGVGLGLAICRGIVELHGGKIWAAQRPGGGLVVRFTLPLDGAPPQILSEEAATS